MYDPNVYKLFLYSDAPTKKSTKDATYKIGFTKSNFLLSALVLAII